MGNKASRHLRSCLRPSAIAGDDLPAFDASLNPLDETLGHSFCYVRSSPAAAAAHSRSSSAASAVEIAFKTISGASVSANSSTILPFYDTSNTTLTSGAFQSSSSFSTLPLQLAGDLDRGFFLSGPIDVNESDATSFPFSGPLVKKRNRKRRNSNPIFRRSFSEKNRRPSVVPERSPAIGSVQWAHGKAGEDRVHVVVSEEQRWLFVGIYDGFNGPEAPEFLVDNLYRFVFDELKGLFWEEFRCEGRRSLREFLDERDEGNGSGLEYFGSGRFALSIARMRSGFGSWRKKAKEVRDVRERRWEKRRVGRVSDHDLVLGALSRALGSAETAYLEMTDRAMERNPEMALMGSCLLVVVMRDEDVYVMNVGDSRAIVAQYGLKEDGEMGGYEGGEIEGLFGREGMDLKALQVSTDHNTSVPEVSFLLLKLVILVHMFGCLTTYFHV